MKIFKRVLLVLAILIGIFVLALGIYVIYMQATYYRIEDDLEIEIENNQEDLVKKNQEYEIVTYNVGFGAYSADYSFFMDSGTMEDGTKVSGEYGKCRSKEEACRNISKSCELLQSLNPDFIFIQEVDTPCYRSHNLDEKKMFTDGFSNYSISYAINYHSSFILLPITDPLGIGNSGILSLSRFKMESSLRKSLPISTSFISKFTDLDRCINIMRYKVDEKELVMINVHLSAYDKGGEFRKKQITLLNDILALEHEKGNYVIVGGDFNQDIANTIGKFSGKQLRPDWIQEIDISEITEGYKFAADDSIGSCRAAEIVYEEGVNYLVTVDGFIVSDNINVVSVKNIYEGNEFLYSDHLPAVMKFELN